MSSVAAAVSKARDFLALVGLMALLGSTWSTWGRIGVGLALGLAVVIASSADGHRLWPRRIPRPTRYGKAA